MNVTGLNKPLEQKHIERRPHKVLTSHLCALKEHINFKLRKPVVSEPEIGLVVIQGLSINFVELVRTPVAIRAKGDKVFIFVLLAHFPRHDVMDINVDITTSRNGASVTSLYENPSS